MPKLSFKGGPWDGVSFDAAVAPDSIQMRNLQIGGDPTLFEYHHYAVHNVSGEPDAFGYKYAPNEKAFWDGLREEEG